MSLGSDFTEQLSYWQERAEVAERRLAELTELEPLIDRERDLARAITAEKERDAAIANYLASEDARLKAIHDLTKRLETAEAKLVDGS